MLQVETNMKTRKANNIYRLTNTAGQLGIQILPKRSRLSRLHMSPFEQFVEVVEATPLTQRANVVLLVHVYNLPDKHLPQSLAQTFAWVLSVSQMLAVFEQNSPSAHDIGSPSATPTGTSWECVK